MDSTACGINSNGDPRTWTTPFYGVTHLGNHRDAKSWVTVYDCGTFAQLSCWYPGCGFSPLATKHATAAAAQAAGEAWLAKERVAA